MRSLSTETDYLKILCPDCVKKTVYMLCYTTVGQLISICEYWNGRLVAGTLHIYFCKQPADQEMWFLFADPHHRARYLRANSFLPLINGEKPHPHLKGSKTIYFHDTFGL